MSLTAAELGQLVHGQLGSGIGGGTDGEGDQNFIGVQPGVVIAQVAGLEILNGFDNYGRDQMHGMSDTAQLLKGVHQDGCRGPQQIGSAAGDTFSIGQLQCNGRKSGGFGTGKGFLDDRTVLC